MHTLQGCHKHLSAVTSLQFTDNFVVTSSDDGTVKLWDLKTGEFIRNLVELPSGGSGEWVWFEVGAGCVCYTGGAVLPEIGPLFWAGLYTKEEVPLYGSVCS